MYRLTFLRCLVAASLLACAVCAWAGKFNPTLNLDDAAPSWDKLPGVDGKEHSLADLADKDVIVVAFTCGSCPYALAYEDRLKALAKSLAESGKGAVVAINANDVARAPEDTLEAMQTRAKAEGFNYAYLRDDKQAVAKAYGAAKTPEFFVLNKARKIVYMGAFDDNSEQPKEVKEKYVSAAVEAALAGKAPAIGETIAVGCLVRYAKSRKKE